MKRYFAYAAGAAMFLMTLHNPSAQAQVNGEFWPPKDLVNPYVELTGDNLLKDSSFVIPPNNILDLDDGYALIDLSAPTNTTNFKYIEFNGEVYTQFWISVNGFITFGKKEKGVLFPPPNLVTAAREPRGLFLQGYSYPVNVIAPFWGNHKYRTLKDKQNGFMNTKVSYKIEADKITVQWKDLNINYIDNAGKEYKASVADFQLIMHKDADPVIKQVAYEFRYGIVGKRQDQVTDEMTSIVSGASVGIKGEGIGVNQKADFINALYNDVYLPYNANNVVNAETLTLTWTPSGRLENSIIVNALGRSYSEEFWGDGDVDFSKLDPLQHKGLPQTRFVTINDAKVIMRSLVTRQALDPVFRRAAYHADVNHDGRFYMLNRSTAKWDPTSWDGNNPNMKNLDFLLKDYSGLPVFDNTYGVNDNYTMDLTFNNVVYTYKIGSFVDKTTVRLIGNPPKPTDSKNLDISYTLKKSINWKNDYYYDQLPNPVSSTKQIFFQVDENDAAMILHFMAGRIPSLPNLLPTVPGMGKDVDNANTGFEFKSPIHVSGNIYKLPVYASSRENSAIATKFDISGKVLNVVSNNGEILSDNSDNTVVIAASGTFSANEPVAFVSFAAENDDVLISNVRINGVNSKDVAFKLSGVDSDVDGVTAISNGPNPFTETTNIAISVVNADNYKVAIFDVNGNEVKVLHNGSLTKGSYNFTWDGTSADGSKVESGMYIYRLIGSDVTISNKMILSK